MPNAPKYEQSISVRFDYPVVFTRDLFNPSNRALVNAANRLAEPRRHRAVVFIDSGFAARHKTMVGSIKKYFAAHAASLELATAPEIVPGGEAIKADVGFARRLVRQFAGLRLNRHAYVIPVGGGAVLDAVGFAASLFHRGLRLIRVPTTVLAQNDVGVGVKNAMNFGGKNAIGTFSPPFAVLNDFDLLRTLSDRDWIAGISEAFKVAIIRDATFFRFLCRNAAKLRARDERSMEHLIRRCAELHLDHIRTSGDPFEFGKARPLDFGHWAAHKLEAMSRYNIGHGHAVAIGIALDSCYARHRGWLTAAETKAICLGLAESGFRLWHPLLERRGRNGRLEILGGLKEFQEHLGGELVITYPKGIGRRFEVQEVDGELVERCLRELKRLSAAQDTGSAQRAS